MSVRRDRILRGDTVRKARRKAAKYAPAGGALYDALREARCEISEREGVPPYVIFSNATLQDMAEKAPKNTEEFMSVTGVGSVKCEKYAKEFLSVIARYNTGA